MTSKRNLTKTTLAKSSRKRRLNEAFGANQENITNKKPKLNILKENKNHRNYNNRTIDTDKTKQQKHENDENDENEENDELQRLLMVGNKQKHEKYPDDSFVFKSITKDENNNNNDNNNNDNDLFEIFCTNQQNKNNNNDEKDENKKKHDNNNNDNDIAIIDYYKFEDPPIGQGTYGTVWKGTDIRTGFDVALKMVKWNTNNNNNNNIKTKSIKIEGVDFDNVPIVFCREIEILQKLGYHPNIVNFRETILTKDKSSFLLVFDHYQYDLRYILNSRHIYKLRLCEVKCILNQILKGIHFAHNKCIIHRDIKPSNILMSKYGRIVLTDFGLSRQCDPDDKTQQLTTKVVSRWYRAPELLYGYKLYSFEIDIWSIGCVLAELLLYEPLFYAHNDLLTLKRIYEILGEPHSKITDKYPHFRRYRPPLGGTYKNEMDDRFIKYGEQCTNLLKRLLEYDQNKRISATDALKHPCFDEEPKPCHEIDIHSSF